MSRTDAHRPLAVHLLDQAIPCHDHRGGPCDLPTVAVWVRLALANTYPGRQYRCAWQLPLGFQYEHPTCGCALCTGKPWRDEQRKRRRADGKKACRTYRD